MDAGSVTSSSTHAEVEIRRTAAGSAASRPFHVTLIAKGAIALIALVVYATFVALYMLHERDRLLHIVQQMEDVHVRHQLLTQVNMSLTHSIVSLQSVVASGATQPPLTEVLLDVASFAPSLRQLLATYPELEPIVGRLERNINALLKEQTFDHSNALRYNEQKLAAQLEYYENEVERRDAQLSVEYRNLDENVAMFAMALNLLGWTVLGVGMTYFFSRLTLDIKNIGARAKAVVAGYDGPPMELTRHDELGDVMDAVNQMQADLRTQEQKQEVSRLRRFHQEKMAAVGSIAAAVAHEVNNPINSISGIAQYTIDAIQSREGISEETIARNAELILRQAERIGLIVRHIADLSAPRSATPELLDVNQLAQTACNLLRYDKRFRNIDLKLELDRELPAIRAVADHLTQVLMNLLINAADALEDLTDRKATIRVTTRKSNGDIVLSVSDNGQGMDPAVLEHVFEQSFSTKPAGKGRGIGLYLCKTLIEETGGVIALESTPGTGTEARIRLPRRQLPPSTP